MRNWVRKSSGYAGFISGLVVFGIWMNIVGNPHVAETAMGVLIAASTGIFVWRKLRRVGGLS
jgi:hypothetical protein